MAITIALYSPFAICAAGDIEAKSEKTVVSEAISMTGGEVKKIDKDADKITIKHGPIANLHMPSMTMVFRTVDSAMLDQVKDDDKVQFRVEKLNGALTITKIDVVTDKGK